MNRKGFGRLEVIAFIAVIALSLTVVTLLINQLLSSTPIQDNLSEMNENSEISTPDESSDVGLQAGNYQELESMIASKSETYFESNSNSEEIQDVTIQTLIQDHYLPQIYDIHNPDLICTGYVEKNNTTTEVKTYLKCETEYQTEGYESLKDK